MFKERKPHVWPLLCVLVALLLLVTTAYLKPTPIHWQPDPGVIVDPTQARTTLTLTAEPQQLLYVERSLHNGAIRDRMIVSHTLTLYNCTTTLPVAITRQVRNAPHTILGRDWLKACARTVKVE